MGDKSTRHATVILNRELNGGEEEPLFLALHESDPGVNGDQSTNEVSYPGYGRFPISRQGGQWSVKDGKASNTQTIDFPISQGRGNTAKYFSIGTAQFGPGEMLRRGRLTKPKIVETAPDGTKTETVGLEIVTGMIPRALPGTITFIES